MPAPNADLLQEQILRAFPLLPNVEAAGCRQEKARRYSRRAAHFEVCAYQFSFKANWNWRGSEAAVGWPA